MPPLKSLFLGLEANKSRDAFNIAGYIDQDETFKYHVSNNENLPAAAVVFDLIGKQQNPTGKVYTNSRKGHWIYTYTSGSGSEGGRELLYAHDSNASAKEAKSMEEGKGKVRVVAGEVSGQGPLKPKGGLFQAAKDLHDGKKQVSYKGVDNHTREKGLHRALRYYMLAAFALLGKGAQAGYDQGNYIAALLVDDQGGILSYGVNSGWFHHGETNMLLNYFCAHSSQSKFPANTIIFSTLTPCQQCSKYLQGTRPDESVIFIGQLDSGSKGSEGEKYGKHLSAVTDPIRNRVAKPKMEVRDTGKFKEVKGWGPTPSKVPITELVQVGETVTKPILETLLSEQMREGSTVAEQIGKNCSEVLIQSRATFAHKYAKKEKRNQELEDQLVKCQVLEYLNTWVEGVNLASKLKTIS